ncbi:hypothetical protein BDE02_01G069300 [Populus trichocarpa]|nr:hypothetical protein BDE02_01G069300 [Populus trichocarpa]
MLFLLLACTLSYKMTFSPAPARSCILCFQLQISSIERFRNELLSGRPLDYHQHSSLHMLYKHSTIRNIARHQGIFLIYHM